MIRFFNWLFGLFSGPKNPDPKRVAPKSGPKNPDQK